jgi:Domain of unknown function (DUF4337)
MSHGEEIHELHEQAEHGHHPGMAPVSFTMALLAVLVAVVTLLGHRSHTEEILLQNRTTDEWAYYQAKNLRRNNLEALRDVMGALQGKDSEKAEALEKKFDTSIEKYADDQKEIEHEARQTEAELKQMARRADRFDIGEVLLEIGLVITSITLLTGRRLYWKLGMAFGALGIIAAASAYMVR